MPMVSAIVVSSCQSRITKRARAIPGFTERGLPSPEIRAAMRPM